MNTHTIKGYFTTPTTELERLERDRERIAWNAERVASHYAGILKEMDERISELKKVQVTHG